MIWFFTIFASFFVVVVFVQPLIRLPGDASSFSDKEGARYEVLRLPDSSTSK